MNDETSVSGDSDAAVKHQEGVMLITATTANGSTVKVEMATLFCIYRGTYLSTYGVVAGQLAEAPDFRVGAPGRLVFASCRTKRTGPYVPPDVPVHSEQHTVLTTSPLVAVEGREMG